MFRGSEYDSPRLRKELYLRLYHRSRTTTFNTNAILTMTNEATSQNKGILAYLQSGKSITPIEALKEFGCFRLSARIFDLRAMGHNIKTKSITINGKTVAQYSMV